jgi:hypothetical protein
MRIPGVNLDDISDMTGMVAPGKYLAKAIEIEASTSQAGNPMAVITFRIEEGDQEGKTIRYYVIVPSYDLDPEDNARLNLRNFKGLMGALGYYDGIVPDDFDLDILKRTNVILTVGTYKKRDQQTGEDKEWPTVIEVAEAPKGTGRGRAATAGRRAAGDGLPV